MWTTGYFEGETGERVQPTKSVAPTPGEYVMVDGELRRVDGVCVSWGQR